MRRLLINATEPEETRIAVLNNDVLDEYYVERLSRETLVGNIYKGVVTTTHPALQAAFVNFGLAKNGFLHVSEVRGEGEGPPPPPGFRPRRRGPRRPPRLVQNLLQSGREVLVQVTRDPFDEKGASLTMEVGIPGRFLVLTPLTPRVGVSKKITNEQERAEKKSMLESLAPPRDLGFIIRTAGAEMNKIDLKKDLEYLVRLWRTVSERHRSTPAPALLYQESELVIRSIRDVFRREMDEVWVDAPPVYDRVLHFFRAVMPRYAPRVHLFRGAEPLLRKYGVEPQIAQIYARKVPLPSGGSIVIEHTEAMTTVDVNSGKLMRTGSPEETAFQTDCEAAEAVARQLRLRDVGGVIVVDFIDVRQERHRRALEKACADAFAGDGSQVTVWRMPDSCLFQIIRQKVRPSPETVSSRACPRCGGAGVVLTPESVSLTALRDCRAHLPKPGVATLELRVSPDVATHLANAKRAQIVELETRHAKSVRIVAVQDLLPEQYEIRAFGPGGQTLEVQ